MKLSLPRFLSVALPMGALSGIALAGTKSGDELVPAFPPASGRTTAAATPAPSSGSTQPLIATCLPAIQDQSGPGCIQASSVPTFGDLLPLSNYFNVTPAADVGIGTATPGGTLHVRKAGDSAKLLLDGDNGAWLRYFDSGVPAWDLTGSFNDYAISRSGVDYPFLIEYATSNIRMNVDAGNVGIGTSAPSRKLDVAGTVRCALSASGELFLADQHSDVPGTIAIDAGSASSQYSELRLKDRGTAMWSLNKRPDNNFGIDAVGINTWLEIQRMTGNVGIGVAPSAFKLDVGGNIRCVTLTQTSAREFKQDIAPLTGALDSILKLQGVTYSWNEKAPEAVQGHEDIGFIADDVDAVLPEIVSKDEDGKVLGLDYGKITPVAVEAIKELNAKNLALEARLAKLESLLAGQAK